MHSYAGGRRFGEVWHPQRGAIPLLGVHARAKHSAVVRQGAGHADESAVAPGEVDAAAERRQLALPVKEIRQREILQPYDTPTASRPFRQRTEIAERRTECRLLRQSTEADALQPRVRLCRHPGEDRHGLARAGRHEDAAILGGGHYRTVDRRRFTSVTR